MSHVIDQLKESCQATFSLKELVEIAKSQPEKFEGIINLDGVLDNIYRAKRCIQAEPRYGSRLLPEKAFIVDHRDMDQDPSNAICNLYLTDKKGRLKNNISEPDTDVKISNRKSNNPNLKVIAFFGGSTIMGDGAQLPQFSIPALVENILNTQYGIDCVCLNYGTLGWTIQDSFNLLTAEALKENLDTVVFYSGWNCVLNFSIAEALKKENPFDLQFRIADGSSNSQVGFNHHLYHRYKPLQSLKHTLSVFANMVSSFGIRLIPIESLRKSLTRAVGKYFPTQADLTKYIMQSVQKSTVAELSTQAVNHYRHINQMAKACSLKSSASYLSYFQPLLYFGNKPLSPEEKVFIDLFNQHPEYYQNFYSLVKDHFPDDEMIDLTGLFDDHFEQLYIDMGHLNKVGYFIVAERIAQDLARIHKQ